MSKTKSVDKTTISMATAIVLAIAYFAVWSFLASPFRAFPGDDGFVASNLLKIDGSAHDPFSVLKYPTPVYYLLAYSIFKFCGVFVSATGGCDVGQIILQIAVASNALILLLLGLVVFRMTGSLLSQFAVHTVYAFAAWPVTYHFMVSYAVTTAALVLLVFCLVIGSKPSSYLRPAVAGFTTALVLWSSSSGPLTAAVLIIAVVFLLWNGSGWRQLLTPSQYDRRLGLFFVSFIVCAAFFGYFGLQQYIEHLLRNLNSDHATDAYRRLGYVPKPPFFSYLHILGVYGRAGLLLMVTALVAILYLVAKKSRAKIHAQTIYTILVLCMFVVLHALLIDLAPSTKLARAHFPAYPVSVMVICIAGYLIYRWLEEIPSARRALRALLSVALIGITYEGAHLSMETRRVRTLAMEHLNELRGTAKLYVLQNDPHGLLMRFGLDWELYHLELPTISANGRRQVNVLPRNGNWDGMIQVINATEFSSLLVKPHQGGIVLLLGPYGEGSGLSLANGRDFYPGNLLDFKSLDPLIKETKVLPYYMHYPPFRMEEEINQALYFLGKTPDYRAPSMGITLLRF